MEEYKVTASSNLKIYFNEIKKYKLLTHEEEIELAKRIENGDKTAFDKMVNSNLRLVVMIAKRYVTPEWKLSDLIQEGNLGLLKSVEKFNFRKGVRFATYASWWIKQAISRSVSNKRRAIRLPHRKEEKLRKINDAIEMLTLELRRKPSLTEIAENLGFDKLDILNLKNISEKIVSIDAEIDDGFTILSILDDNINSPEILFEKNNLKNDTLLVLDELKDKEREVLKSRYAIDMRSKQTLKNIAKSLGLSTETVRQIEMKAIKKIKENYSYLKDYLYC
ncbi:MAG: sigma-70 family RNA polymerase sigma factor [Spirochaetes bacterium]|nr:sigma-70 family RNA polymerase sigma factor [Spirochaetota bacterium]